VVRSEQQSSTQLGTSSWVLNSGAPFKFLLTLLPFSSFLYLDFHFNVLTANGTSLLVASRGNLSTFSIPDVFHIPRLIMNLFSVVQISNYDCLWLGLALGDMTFGVFRS
jgi:hypothetical protein